MLFKLLGKEYLLYRLLKYYRSKRPIDSTDGTQNIFFNNTWRVRSGKFAFHLANHAISADRRNMNQSNGKLHQFIQELNFKPLSGPLGYKWGNKKNYQTAQQSWEAQKILI